MGLGETEWCRQSSWEQKDSGGGLRALGCMALCSMRGQARQRRARWHGTAAGMWFVARGGGQGVGGREEGSAGLHECSMPHQEATASAATAAPSVATAAAAAAAALGSAHRGATEQQMPQETSSTAHQCSSVDATAWMPGACGADAPRPPRPAPRFLGSSMRSQDSRSRAARLPLWRCDRGRCAPASGSSSRVGTSQPMMTQQKSTKAMRCVKGSAAASGRGGGQGGAARCIGRACKGQTRGPSGALRRAGAALHGHCDADG